MTFTISIHYIKFSSLEEKRETANCTRFTIDKDDNIRYNCSFSVEKMPNLM